MGRYISWDDVIDRYPELNTLGGSDELSSAFIVYSEAYVDGLLSNNFTIPFSNNNMVIKDLAIDYCYWRAARFKVEDATAVKSEFFVNISMIIDGTMIMIDDAGTLIEPDKKKIGLFSSTGSYHSSFGMTDPIDWSIDEDNISDDMR